MQLINIVFTLAAAFAASLVQAAPVLELVKKDVADPPITSPDSSTVWVVGTTQTVTWDTSNLPSQITNTQGTILLGFMNDSTSNEHLMINSPLAKGFDITSGSTTITVPSVADGSDYIIALMGDSGNISPKFTISSSSSSGSSVSSSPASNNAAASSTVSTTLPASILSTVNPSTSASPIPPSGSTSSQGSPTTVNTSLSHASVTTTSLSSGSASGSNSASAANSSQTSSAARLNVPLSRFAHFVIPLVVIAFVF